MIVPPLHPLASSILRRITQYPYPSFPRAIYHPPCQTVARRRTFTYQPRGTPSRRNERRTNPTRLSSACPQEPRSGSDHVYTGELVLRLLQQVPEVRACAVQMCSHGKRHLAAVSHVRLLGKQEKVAHGMCPMPEEGATEARMKCAIGTQGRSANAQEKPLGRELSKRRSPKLLQSEVDGMYLYRGSRSWLAAQRI